jgi:hypothetical protein
MKRLILLVLTIGMCSLLMGADGGCDHNRDSDMKQTAQQETLNAEGAAQTGMPAMSNFRERKLLKQILEMRDQTTLRTYTYVWNEFNGKLVFFCDSVGYGIPYATQYTSPQKDIYYTSSSSVHMAMPQADPNGLFSPASAEGTWIVCKDPEGTDTRPVYVEPRIIVSPFPLKTAKN